MTEKQIATEALLISRFLNGDNRTFELLINPHRQRLYTYLCRMTGEAEAAKDLLQDVLLKVLQALPNYREQTKFSNWLFSIAHNLAINHVQRNQRQAALFDNDFRSSEPEFLPALSVSPEDILRKKELQVILKNAIEKLPPEQKQVLLLRQYSEMPFKEIAELLDTPQNTVLGRMRYALLNLRKIIQQETGGEISNEL